jgi:hypothetical protein
MVLTLVPFRCGGICHCRLNINNNNRAKGFTSYVFGRYDGVVYIYNAKGILSTIPHKHFVKFKN